MKRARPQSWGMRRCSAARLNAALTLVMLALFWLAVPPFVRLGTGGRHLGWAEPQGLRA